MTDFAVRKRRLPEREYQFPAKGLDLPDGRSIHGVNRQRNHAEQWDRRNFEWVMYQIGNQPQQKQQGPIGRVYFNNKTRNYKSVSTHKPTPLNGNKESNEKCRKPTKSWNVNNALDALGPKPSPAKDPADTSKVHMQQKMAIK